MNIGQDWFYITHHMVKVLSIIGDIIAVDAVVKQVALKYGYSKLASLCDMIASALSFILDVLSGIISILKNKTQPPTKGT